MTHCNWLNRQTSVIRTSPSPSPSPPRRHSKALASVYDTIPHPLAENDVNRLLLRKEGPKFYCELNYIEYSLGSLQRETRTN